MIFIASFINIMNLNHQSKIWLILVALWVINGSSFLAIKVAIDTIPPLLSAGIRFSFAGAILFTFYFLQVNKTIFKNNSIPVTIKNTHKGRKINSGF